MTRLSATALSALLGVVASLTAVPAEAQSSGAAPAGSWVSLFNGQNLAGWGRLNGSATFVVENGQIVGRSVPGSANSFLVTDSTYGDFELELEVLADTGMNSGVQIRSRGHGSTRPQDLPTRVNGPQIEIESSGADGAEAGYVYGEASGGWQTPEERLKPHKAFLDGQWNRYRIVARGPRIQTFINDQPIEDITLDPAYHQTYARGFIGLQVHGVGERTKTYTIRWRNLRIRPLL